MQAEINLCRDGFEIFLNGYDICNPCGEWVIYYGNDVIKRYNTLEEAINYCLEN